MSGFVDIATFGLKHMPSAHGREVQREGAPRRLIRIVATDETARAECEAARDEILDLLVFKDWLLTHTDEHLIGLEIIARSASANRTGFAGSVIEVLVPATGAAPRRRSSSAASSVRSAVGGGA